jgi:hypothetical protein
LRSRPHPPGPRASLAPPSLSASRARATSRSPLSRGRHPDLYYWKTTVFSPELLRLNGVPVFRVNQRAGSFVVTLPCAYHSGFNRGFNASESVNFALPAWLPVGAAALERYRTAPRRDSTLLHAALIVNAALAAADAADTRARGEPPADAHAGCARARHALAVELCRLLREEVAERSALLASGVRGCSPLEQSCLDALANLRREPFEDGSSARAEAWRCRECRHVSYAAAVRCACEPARRRNYLCLRHALAVEPAPAAPAANHKKGKAAAAAAAQPPASAAPSPAQPARCACAAAERELLVRYSPAQLLALLERLEPAMAAAERGRWPPPLPTGALERAATTLPPAAVAPPPPRAMQVAEGMPGAPAAGGVDEDGGAGLAEGDDAAARDAAAANPAADDVGMADAVKTAPPEPMEVSSCAPDSDRGSDVDIQ